VSSRKICKKAEFMRYPSSDRKRENQYLAAWEPKRERNILERSEIVYYIFIFLFFTKSKKLSSGDTLLSISF
jgi:hypothetical protein